MEIKHKKLHKSLSPLYLPPDPDMGQVEQLKRAQSLHRKLHTSQGGPLSPIEQGVTTKSEQLKRAQSLPSKSKRKGREPRRASLDTEVDDVPKETHEKPKEKKTTGLIKMVRSLSLREKRQKSPVKKILRPPVVSSYRRGVSGLPQRTTTRDGDCDICKSENFFLPPTCSHQGMNRASSVRHHLP